MNICFITMGPYWMPGVGRYSRTRELMKVLRRHGQIRVLFLARLDEPYWQAWNLAQYPEQLVRLAMPEVSLPENRRAALVEYFASNPPADLYMVDKTEISDTLDGLPEDGEKWVDTHDLVSERTRKLVGREAVETDPMTAPDEAAVLKRYDKVICIQRDEAALVANWVGAERTLLASHAVAVSPKPIENPPLNIGFVASGWHANAYGLRDFVRHVWPTVRQSGAALHVYGTVCDTISARIPAVTFHGFQEDIEACYENLDIVINPVQYGAGLKIKTVEALARGLPVVTSREGASGLEHLDGRALLIADDWQSFAGHLSRLVNNYEACRSLGDAALAFATRQLAPDACYAEVEKALTRLASI
ncbi:MAG: glycosyltransferase family 4 protein [Pseudomonadota bacterium]